jgi:predicted GNAT family N-acyltransferase
MNEKSLFAPPIQEPHQPPSTDKEKADEKEKIAAEAIPLPPGIVVADSEQFPDLKGFYRHPIYGWIEGDPVKDALAEGWRYDERLGWVEPQHPEYSEDEFDDLSNQEHSPYETLSEPLAKNKEAETFQSPKQPEKAAKIQPDTPLSEQINHVKHILQTLPDPRPELTALREETDRYFLRAYIDQILKKPLSDRDINFKRRLLGIEWQNMLHTIDFSYLSEFSDLPEEIHIEDLAKAHLDDFSDKTVEYLFDAYGEACPEYFRWQERIDLHRRYHEKDLKKNYAIDPLGAGRAFNKNQFIRESTYSRLSSAYGAIYAPDGSIDSFFKLDRDVEKNEEMHRERFGSIDEYTLRYFTSIFKESIANGNAQDCVRYLQIRSLLPRQLVSDWEARHAVSFPPELLHPYDTLTQFEQESSAFKQELSETIMSLHQKGALDELITSLDLIVTQRQEIASRENFGYASEDTDQLDFFSSFVMTPPQAIKGNKHFSILYYLYLKQNLPCEIVTDFEEQFQVSVPEELRHFETLDQFLKTDDRILLEAFSQTPNIRNAALWLQERINELSDKIRASKVVPERITLEDMFLEEGFDTAGTEPESREALLSNYSILVSPNFRRHIEGAFGISLNQFDIRTQLQFLDFLSRSDASTVAQTKWFLYEGTIDKLSPQETKERMVTFLALENKNLGFQDIIDIDAVFGEDTAKEIFRKYYEIHASAMRIFQEIHSFTKTPQDKNTCLSIRNRLLEKATALIMDYVQKAKEEREQIKKSAVIFTRDILDRQQVIIKEISSIRADIEFFRIAFKELYRNKNVKGFSEIEGVEFSSLNGWEIPKENQEEMRRIYAANYTSKDYPSSFRDTLLRDFDKALEKDSSVFYIVKKDGVVIAFNRFDHLKNGSTHFGSFNVDPRFASSHIGDALFQTSMNEEHKRASRIVAECDSRKPISAYYIDQGFVATGIDMINNTIPAFIIEWDKNKRYASKDMSLETIGSLSGKEAESIVIKKFSASEVRDFELLKQGYVLTRYYLHSQTGDSYCVFEKQTSNASD